MILLDTDHLSIHAIPGGKAHDLLASRMLASHEDFGTTIVCVEEQLRGWLAAIHRKHDVEDQVIAYTHLGELWDYYRDWPILPFSTQSARRFKQLRKQKIRIGTQDLKIAAIALTHDALLLSANLRDFKQVPGLRVENWLSD